MGIQLMEALSGRTWSGKEAILTSVKELICANPDNIKQMLDNPEDPLTEDILMKCLIRECGKERLEYKIVALEGTSKVLQAMDLNYFKPLYEMLIPFIRKAFDEEIERKKREESEKNEDNEVESKQAKKSDEDEAETFSLDLQLASVECLGQAWPETPETQNEFIEELLNILDAMIKKTTVSRYHIYRPGDVIVQSQFENRRQCF